MATISSRTIIEEMLENDGTFPGDRQASSIWEYEHRVSGRIMWAVFWNEIHNDLHLSPYIARYRCLWTRERGQLAHINCLEGELGELV